MRRRKNREGPLQEFFGQIGCFGILGIVFIVMLILSPPDWDEIERRSVQRELQEQRLLREERIRDEGRVALQAEVEPERRAEPAKRDSERRRVLQSQIWQQNHWDTVQEYWLNTLPIDDVRHNRSCQFFRNTKYGRFCGPNEGRPCGNCGG